MRGRNRMKKIAMVLVLFLLLSACGTQDPAASQFDVSEASEISGFGMDAAEPAEAETMEATPVETEEPAAEVSVEVPEPVDGSGEEASTEPAQEQNPVLVVYFSRMGNTDFPADVDAVSRASLVIDHGELKGNAQLLAEWMAGEAGCDTWEITTTEQYPVDYDETTDVAKVEQNNSDRPELSAHIDGFDGIETVYLVYPNWWADLPMALYSFFDEYDFSGKTIYVSVTHGGSGFSGGISTIQSLEPGTQVIEGLSIRDSAVPDSEDDVRQWVRETER